jgi:hypothetical protein
MIQNFRSNADIARQFRALAERRRAHFADLQKNGRWRKYFSEETLISYVDKATQEAATWGALCEASAQVKVPPAPPKRIFVEAPAPETADAPVVPDAPAQAGESSPEQNGA